MKNWKVWLPIIATILAIIISGITIYDRFFGQDDYIFEQKLSPEAMKNLKEGDEIVIEKGITIRRGDTEDGSGN